MANTEPCTAGARMAAILLTAMKQRLRLQQAHLTAGAAPCCAHSCVKELSCKDTASKQWHRWWTQELPHCRCTTQPTRTVNKPTPMASVPAWQCRHAPCLTPCMCSKQLAHQQYCYMLAEQALPQIGPWCANFPCCPLCLQWSARHDRTLTSISAPSSEQTNALHTPAQQHACRLDNTFTSRTDLQQHICTRIPLRLYCIVLYCIVFTAHARMPGDACNAPRPTRDGVAVCSWLEWLAAVLSTQLHRAAVCARRPGACKVLHEKHDGVARAQSYAILHRKFKCTRHA
ncbi:hypothetical protein COO60DRAFT_1487884 [Scenedesmus sp. NREL 46B-D3]|nr:hypothetical protein COO60DRAFT_1487884 [Scenedesmus sp. NREL 46B-D3]